MLNNHIPVYSKALAVFSVLMGLALIVAVLVMVRDVISLSYNRPAKHVPPVEAGPQKPAKGIHEYDSILRDNPFGFSAGELRPLSSAAEGGVSQSDVKLIGTVAGTHARSYAIFMDRGGRQEVFKVGDSVFGIGKLKKVDAEKVSVSENGRVINIPLADMLTIKDVSQQESKGGLDFARSVGLGTFIVDQKKILHALENPNQLMTDARLQPNILSGKQEGFILREVRVGGIYQSLGLQNGDVLIRINDYNISNPENALQAFTALRGMDRVQLDIMRGGAKMTMTYQIR